MTFRMFSAVTSASLLLLPATVLAAVSIPKGAQGVQLLTATLRNTCDGPAVVRAVTLRHTGLGDPDDLTAVYAVDASANTGGKRLSSPASFSGRMGVTAVVRLRSFHLAACASRTVTFAANIAPDADSAGEHGLEITDLTTDGGDVTVEVKDSVVTQTIGPAVGSVAVSYAGLTQTVRYGANRTVARIRLEADQERDQLVHSIRLTNDGSARDADLRNIRVESSRGETLTSIADSLDGDQVLLTFDPPLAIGSGNEILVIVKADVRASRKRTIRLEVEEPADVLVTPARGR